MSITEFEKIKFGIELETCVHMLGQSEFEYNFSQERLPKFLRALRECARKKFPSFNWKIIDTVDMKRDDKYDGWILMSDGSVYCETATNYQYGDEDDDDYYDDDDNYTDKKHSPNIEHKNRECIVKGRSTDMTKCDNMTFVPIELVSPALKGTKGLQLYMMVISGFLLADNMVLLVNDTQGLHINLSHPQMNDRNFLILWSIYEPLILQMLPERRRKQNEEYARPVKTDFKSPYQYKYTAVSVKHNRIEIRIQESILNPNKLILWIIMMMQLLAQSVHYAEQLSRVRYIDQNYANPQEFNRKVGDFTTKVLVDKILIKYFMDEYNRNKDEKWPEIDFPENKDYPIIFPNIDDFFDEKKIAYIKSIVCEDYNYSIANKHILEGYYENNTGKVFSGLLHTENPEKDITSVLLWSFHNNHDKLMDAMLNVCIKHKIDKLAVFFLYYIKRKQTNKFIACSQDERLNKVYNDNLQSFFRHAIRENSRDILNYILEQRPVLVYMALYDAAEYNPELYEALVKMIGKSHVTETLLHSMAASKDSRLFFTEIKEYKGNLSHFFPDACKGGNIDIFNYITANFQISTDLMKRGFSQSIIYNNIVIAEHMYNNITSEFNTKDVIRDVLDEAASEGSDETFIRFFEICKDTYREDTFLHNIITSKEKDENKLVKMAQHLIEITDMYIKDDFLFSAYENGRIKIYELLESSQSS